MAVEQQPSPPSYRLVADSSVAVALFPIYNTCEEFNYIYYLLPYAFSPTATLFVSVITPLYFILLKEGRDGPMAADCIFVITRWRFFSLLPERGGCFWGLPFIHRQAPKTYYYYYYSWLVLDTWDTYIGFYYTYIWFFFRERFPSFVMVDRLHLD